METWMVILIVVAVVAIAALVWWAMSRRRTADLRDRFGPEYDRTVETTEDRRTAERELAARQARREQLNIRPLTADARQRYESQWKDVQAQFVDQPTSAVARADELVLAVMRERGYPMDDFEQRAADVSVDHPKVVEHYRAAHGISVRVGTNASTEDMRQAVVHYRALFAELLRADDDAVETPPMPREAAR